MLFLGFQTDSFCRFPWGRNPDNIEDEIGVFVNYKVVEDLQIY